MAKLAAAEAELRAKSAGNPAIGDPWADIARATAPIAASIFAYRFIQPSGDLMEYATALVRAAAERAKPNSERLPGYSDGACRCSKSRCSIPSRSALARPAQARMEPQQGARISRRRRSGHQAASRQGIAGRAGGRLVDGDASSPIPPTARRYGMAAQAAIDGLEGPDDRLRPPARPALPPAAGRARRALSSTGDRRPGQARGCPLRRLWRHHLSRRDVHAAHQLRQGAWDGPSAGRRCRPSPMLGGTYDRATGADPFDLPSAFVAARSRIDPNDRLRFRHHQRHHRRQFGLAGDRPFRAR